MTLTGMKKHVGVLEQAGLVATEKVGRVRTTADLAALLAPRPTCGWRQAVRLAANDPSKLPPDPIAEPCVSKNSSNIVEMNGIEPSAS
jgi:hypothetical protein